MSWPSRKRYSLKRARMKARRRPMLTNVPERGSRRWLVQTLDRLTSWIVRGSNPQCVVCGETDRQKLTNGHLYSRRFYATRWDTEPGGNCATQCKDCNLRHTFNPFPFFDWYVSTYGSPALIALQTRRDAKVHFSDDDLNQLVLSHERRLRELKEVV